MVTHRLTSFGLLFLMACGLGAQDKPPTATSGKKTYAHYCGQLSFSSAASYLRLALLNEL